MPAAIPIGKTDLALISAEAGEVAKATAPGAVDFAAITTDDVPGLSADLAAKVDLTTDQEVAGVKTLAAATVKPDTKPIHFKTTTGANRLGLAFTFVTNGGHPFEDSEGNILYDDILQRGLNLGADVNPYYVPGEITAYDNHEAAYLVPDGKVLTEWNREATRADWPGPRRYHGTVANHANGHGNHLHQGDYHQFKSNSSQLSAFQIGVSTNIGFGPFGIYEVELTGALSDFNGMGTGYTNGTDYPLIITGDGTGATGLFDVVNGAVKNVRLTHPGHGYTTAAVSFANGGAGTGAEAFVQIGSVSSTLPINVRNIVGAYGYWLGNTSGSQQQYTVAAADSTSGNMYGGFNFTDDAGTFKHIATGAMAGMAYLSSGGIDWYAAGSQPAGTAANRAMRLSAAGGLTLLPSTSTTLLQATLPTVQSDNLVNLVKPGTLAPVFQVTKDGYVGNNAGSGVTAPGDFTRVDQGNMLQLGANGVKSLFVAEYNSGQVNLKGSAFGPFQLMSGAGQDINLIPTTTGKIGLQGPITITNAKDITLGTTTGTKLGTAATQKLGFFGATPIVQPTLGAATAGDTYTATEKAMLQAVYDALRNLGLGS